MQNFAIFDEYAVLCAFACCNHQRHRSCKSKCAWATDDKHGNGKVQRVEQTVACCKPHNKCHKRNCHNHRHKHRCNLIRKFLDGCFGCAGAFHKGNNFGKGAFLANGGNLNLYVSANGNCTTNNNFARLFFHRDGFAS